MQQKHSIENCHSSSPLKTFWKPIRVCGDVSHS